MDLFVLFACSLFLVVVFVDIDIYYYGAICSKSFVFDLAMTYTQKAPATGRRPGLRVDRDARECSNV